MGGYRQDLVARLNSWVEGGGSKRKDKFEKKGGGNRIYQGWGKRLFFGDRGPPSGKGRGVTKHLKKSLRGGCDQKNQNSPPKKKPTPSGSNVGY